MESGSTDRKRLTGSIKFALSLWPNNSTLCLPERIFSNSCLHNTGVYNVHYLETDDMLQQQSDFKCVIIITMIFFFFFFFAGSENTKPWNVCAHAQN